MGSEDLLQFLSSRALVPSPTESIQRAQTGWLSRGFSFAADDERDYSRPVSEEFPPNLDVIAPMARRRLQSLVTEFELEVVFEERYRGHWSLPSPIRRLAERATLIRELRASGYFGLSDFDFGGHLRQGGGVLHLLQWLAGTMQRRSTWVALAWWGHWTRPKDQNGQARPRGSRIEWTIEATLPTVALEGAGDMTSLFDRLSRWESRYESSIEVYLVSRSLRDDFVSEGGRAYRDERLQSLAFGGHSAEVVRRHYTPMDAEDPGSWDFARLPWTSTVLRVSGETGWSSEQSHGYRESPDE